MKTLLFICLFLVALDAHTSEEETITLPMRFAGADVDDDSHTTAFIQSFSAIFVSEIGDRVLLINMLDILCCCSDGHEIQ